MVGVVKLSEVQFGLVATQLDWPATSLDWPEGCWDWPNQFGLAKGQFDWPEAKKTGRRPLRLAGGQSSSFPQELDNDSCRQAAASF